MKRISTFKQFINEQEKTAQSLGDFIKDAGKIFTDAGFGNFINADSSVSGSAGGYAAPANVRIPTEAEKQENIKIINAAMDRHGITDKNVRSAILGIIGNESGWIGADEESYYKTGFPRMKELFTSRVEGHEAEIESWKKLSQQEFDKNFWELVYGYKTKTGRDIGNTQPGDGEKYRGRGFHQLTGKGEYQNMQEMYDKFKAANPEAVKDIPNIDIVNRPETMADPKIGAEICVLYFIAGMEAAKKKYPTLAKDGNMSKDDAVMAISHINAGLGANMNTPRRRDMFAKARGYQDDILNKNLT